MWCPASTPTQHSARTTARNAQTPFLPVLLCLSVCLPTHSRRASQRFPAHLLEDAEQVQQQQQQPHQPGGSHQHRRRLNAVSVCFCAEIASAAARAGCRLCASSVSQYTACTDTACGLALPRQCWCTSFIEPCWWQSTNSYVATPLTNVRLCATSPPILLSLYPYQFVTKMQRRSATGQAHVRCWKSASIRRAQTS